LIAASSTGPGFWLMFYPEFFRKIHLSGLASENGVPDGEPLCSDV
jgi:hypothetical protein